MTDARGEAAEKAEKTATSPDAGTAARSMSRGGPDPAGHEMLLRLAGRGPDDLLARCRTWLAQGRRADIGRALTHAAVAWGVRLPEADIDLLDGMLREAGADPSVLALVTQTAPTGLSYGFAPTLALARDCLAGEADPWFFWPGEGGPEAAVPHDEVCETAIRSVMATAEAKALWRAWRFPVDGSPWPDPRRVYVIETSADADCAAVAETVQKALEAAGEYAPQVETYSIGAALPEYQRQARACGALLWSSTPDPGVRVADVLPDAAAEGFEGFEDGTDDADGTDGGYDDRPDLDEDERARLSAYLWAGEPLLVADEPIADPIVPDTLELAPPWVRTDGFWVWSDAVAHSLDHHGLSPVGDLVEHVRARGYAAPPVDGAAVYRALAALRDLMS